MRSGGGRFGYFLSRAIGNMRQNMAVNLLTIGTITLALLILSLFLLVYVNLEGVVEDWSSRVQVTAYFDRELTAAEQASMQESIRAIPGTDRIEYVTKSQALSRFRARLKGQEALLEGVSAEVLPASFEIRLKRGNRDSDAVQIYAIRLKRVPGIVEVQYGEEWVKRFNTFMNFLRVVGALLGGFLVLAVVFIVSNTIKLTIYARRDELELMGLVGATRFFIKAPFIIEGVLQGAIGALFSLLTLAGLYLVFLYHAGNFLSFNPADAGLAFLPVGYLVWLFLGGVMLGFFGSVTSLKRFING
jgi:cell division transport system permease protein